MRSANFELTIHWQNDTYFVDARFWPPDRTIDKLFGEKIPVDIDEQVLLSLALDPIAYGRYLTEQLFPVASELRNNWILARGLADGANAVLCLRLRLSSTNALPHTLRWETLRDPLTDQPLATDAKLQIVRHFASADTRSVQAISRSELEVLLVVASPSDLAEYALSEINTEAEVERVRRSVGQAFQLTVIGDCDTAIVRRATFDTLINTLQARRPAVLTLVCHAKHFDGDTFLWLEDEEGRTSRISGVELGSVLTQLEKPPLLTMLIACESGGPTGHINAMGALGPRLAHAGLKAVIAMQDLLSVDAAYRFLTVLFTELVADPWIDRAVTLARLALRHTLEWWVPALWLSSWSGQLWLGDTAVSFDTWRRAQNLWLARCFQSAETSRAHFGEAIHVAGAGAMVIERSAMWARLETWLTAWTETRAIGVFLGEEGDGKTWAVTSWLQRQMTERDDFPTVLFLSSAELANHDPGEAILNEIGRTLGLAYGENVRDLLLSWLEDEPLRFPRILLVLDGINEQHNASWWRAFFEKTAVVPWSVSTAVLVTCRNEYWQPAFRDVPSLRVLVQAIDPYDDNELTRALTSYNLRLTDIQPELLELARKPRYLDLLIRFREQLIDSGDVTVARLIYEDWRDRWSRKRNLPITDQEFQNIIRELARKYLEGSSALLETHIRAALPSQEPRIIEELRTGGVLRMSGGRYRVQKHHLALGLALILTERVEDAVEAGRDITETIATWLEPHKAIDLKARIGEIAALHALYLPNLPRNARTALLVAWITNQNAGEQAVASCRAYFRIDRQSYALVAERIWASGLDHRRAQRVLMQVFLQAVLQNDEPLEFWQETLERWLGFVHRAGYPHQRDKNDPSQRSIRDEIEQRVGFSLSEEPFSVAEHLFTPINDDGLLRLGRVAITLISHMRREPFIRAIGAACMADAIMGVANKYDLLAWTIRSATTDVWPLVEAEVQVLLTIHTTTAERAAYRLLSMVGNHEALQLRSTLPSDLIPRHPLTELYEQDPCTFNRPWQRPDCEHCLTRDDLSPTLIARQLRELALDPTLITPADLGQRLAQVANTLDISSMRIVLARTAADRTFEEYEVALCAYAPTAIAEVVRALIRTISSREGLARQLLAMELKEYSLLYTAQERMEIYGAWSAIQDVAYPWGDETETAEEFLFAQIFPLLKVDEQLPHLVRRPAEANDLLVLERSFRRPANWTHIWQYLDEHTNIAAVRRTLWFLSSHAEILPPEDLINHVLPLLQHSESQVRGLAYEVIVRAGNAEAIQKAIQADWQWQGSFHYSENMWGSLLVCTYGKGLPFTEIKRRVYPLYFGYAVQARDYDEDDVITYATWLHQSWLHTASGVINLPAGFPRIYVEAFFPEDAYRTHRKGIADTNSRRGFKLNAMGSSWGGEEDTNFGDLERLFTGQAFEQQQSESFDIVQASVEQQTANGNEWFAQRFLPDGLAHVARVRPDLFNLIVGDVCGGHPQSRALVQATSTFLETICEVLLKEGSTGQGLQLYWYLREVETFIFTQDERSELSLLDLALFSAPDTVDIRAAWIRRLEECITDKDLLELAVAAQLGNAGVWLQTYIQESVHSPAPRARMSGMTLLGLVESEDSHSQLASLLSTLPNTWMHDLASEAQRRSLRNNWARYWFQQFLVARDEVLAWASFRLFLHCVDQRFWIWQSQIASKELLQAINRERRAFLDANMETIAKRIKKNGGELAKQFLGHKVRDNEVWPWM